MYGKTAKVDTLPNSVSKKRGNHPLNKTIMDMELEEQDRPGYSGQISYWPGIEINDVKPLHKCVTCEEIFQQYKDLENHNKIHCKLENHSEIGLKSKQNSGNINLQKKESKDFITFHQCVICKEIFSDDRPADLENHKQIHLQEKTQSGLGQEKFIRNDQKGYSIPCCYSTDLLSSVSNFDVIDEGQLSSTVTEANCFISNSSNQQNKRVRDKKNICLYCEKPQTKLVRHLRRKHKDEIDVQEILSFPQGSKKCMTVATKVRYNGNYNHNIKALQNGYGEILVARRSKKGLTKNVSNYTPCKLCKGFFLAKDLWRHVQRCDMKESESGGSCAGKRCDGKESESGRLCAGKRCNTKESESGGSCAGKRCDGKESESGGSCAGKRCDGKESESGGLCAGRRLLADSFENRIPSELFDSIDNEVGMIITEDKVINQLDSKLVWKNEEDQILNINTNTREIGRLVKVVREKRRGDFDNRDILMPSRLNEISDDADDAGDEDYNVSGRKNYSLYGSADKRKTGTKRAWKRRKRWTSSEEAILAKVFQSNIVNKKNVSSKEIRTLKENFQELRDRTDAIIRSKMNNIILGKIKRFKI